MHQEFLKLLERLQNFEYEDIYVSPYGTSIGSGVLLKDFNLKLLEGRYRNGLNVGVHRELGKAIDIPGYHIINAEYLEKHITYFRIGNA